MSLTRFISELISVLFIQQIFSKPPNEVLTSCINLKPSNSSVALNLLNSGGFFSESEKNCDKRYEIHSGIHEFNYLSCDDNDFLIISGQKMFLDTSVNMSVNPEIKPEVLFPHLSRWTKIDYNSQSYLCISGPLSQSGSGANSPQYFIVENAFRKNAKPIAYYYFFNKDIIPITSKHF